MLASWKLLYLRPQVQDQVFDHLPKWLGELQQLVDKVVTSPEAHDVDHPHPLMKERTDDHSFFLCTDEDHSNTGIQTKNFSE